MVVPTNCLAGTNKTNLTAVKNLNNRYKIRLNLMKLKSGVGIFYAIWPGIDQAYFTSPEGRTGPSVACLLQ